MVTLNPDFLEATCVKQLSSVEVDLFTSNQHELNGVSRLKRILGTERKNVVATFSVVNGTGPQVDAEVTWYDARENHPTRTEFRLYFRTNAVMTLAQPGDRLLIGHDASGHLHCLLART